MVRRCCVNFQCRGVLLINIIVGHGPIALAVGVGGVVWTFLSRLSFLSSFSHFLGDGSIKTQTLLSIPTLSWYYDEPVDYKFESRQFFFVSLNHLLLWNLLLHLCHYLISTNLEARND